MPLLRKILAKFGFPQYKTKENYTLPWGLTENDNLALTRLSKSEDFEIWRKTLDNVVNSYAEHLLIEENSDRIHFLRGKIQGVRYALEIVDEIHFKEQDFLINERRRAESNAGPNANTIRGATFGTPSWRRTG